MLSCVLPPIIILQIVPPVHGLRGEELQLIVVQAEAAEAEQTSKCLRGQVVQGVMAQAKPLDVVQALEERGSDPREILMANMYVCFTPFCICVRS